jgi:hypothetical protein
MSAEPAVRTATEAAGGEDATAAQMVVDLVCDSRTPETVVSIAEQWCRLRPISERTIAQATTLLSEAGTYGLQFGPRSLRLRVVCVDHQKIWMALTWRGCGHGTTCSTTDLERTAETFESLANAWGFEAGRTGQTHWFLVDDSRSVSAE